MLMEKARCPSCNSLNVKRHCKSPCCIWFICPCKISIQVSHLVFDRQGRMFLEMKK